MQREKRKGKRDANMCDALRELMKDDLEDARKMGEAKGKAEGRSWEKQKSSSK